MRVAHVLLCASIHQACAHDSPQSLPKSAPKAVISPPTLAPPQAVKALGNGFHIHHARRPNGSIATIYSNRDRLDQGPPKPALIVVTGSGCGSAFRRRPDGSISQGFPGYFLRAAADRYTILVLEKRGVEPLAGGGGGEATNCPPEYHQYATRDARVEEQILLMRSIGSWQAVDRARIVLVGHSEGTDVVSGAATTPSVPVTHVGFLSGGGPTQMYDFVLMIREQSKSQPPEVVEKQITALMDQFRDIFQDPNNTTKMMFGHPYSRWAGFFPDAPVEDLLQLKVPLFVAHGSADTSVPITSADFIEVEFIRHRKTNLTFRRYPGLDHSYWACDRRDPKCDGSNDKMNGVVDDFLKWVELSSPQTTSSTPSGS